MSTPPHLDKILRLTATEDELDLQFYGDLEDTGRIGPVLIPDLQDSASVDDVVAFMAWGDSLSAGDVLYGTVVAIKRVGGLAANGQEDNPTNFIYRVVKDVGPEASGRECAVNGMNIYHAAEKSAMRTS